MYWHCKLGVRLIRLLNRHCKLFEPQNLETNKVFVCLAEIKFVNLKMHLKLSILSLSSPNSKKAVPGSANLVTITLVLAKLRAQCNAENMYNLYIYRIHQTVSRIFQETAFLNLFLSTIQGLHGKFEPGKVQYSTPIFF